MSLHPLAQLGQVALALGLGAVLGLLFDVLRVPRRHARRAFLRAVLYGLLCLGQRTGFAAAGAIFPPLRAKNAPICRPRTEICKKSLDFCKKTLPKSPQMF